jgi:hypothetical protein
MTKDELVQSIQERLETFEQYDKDGVSVMPISGTVSLLQQIKKDVESLEESRGDPAAYLVTGGKAYVDKPFVSKDQAERSVVERKDGATVVPLYRGNAKPEGQSQPPKLATSHVLTDAERQAIRAFAEGDESQIAKAAQAYWGNVFLRGPQSCLELQFMSQVLTPGPDLVLQAKYRKELLSQPGPAKA